MHILFTEETEYTFFYGSMPEAMLKITNGVFYETLADSYSHANLPITSVLSLRKANAANLFLSPFFTVLFLRKNKPSK